MCHPIPAMRFDVTLLAPLLQLLVSGGWDKTALVWDLRVARAVRKIYGPYMCGDSIDVSGSTLLTGAWRRDAPLQLWDMGTGRLLTDMPFWYPASDECCMVYTAKYVRGPGRQVVGIMAGGSGQRPLARLYKQVSAASTC